MFTECIVKLKLFKIKMLSQMAKLHTTNTQELDPVLKCHIRTTPISQGRTIFNIGNFNKNFYTFCLLTSHIKHGILIRNYIPVSLMIYILNHMLG